MTEHSIDRRRNSSDRNPVEEALKEQYSTLRSIIDSANALIFSVDRHYRYTSFNKGHATVMKALYGAEIEQGRSLYDYMTVPEDREASRRNLDRALNGEQLVEEAYSGEELRSRQYFQVSHSPIKTDTGEIIGVAVLAQDMTERKRSELELLDRQQRLSEVTVELSLAEERERRRIATELHDNIGQDLVLARINLGMLAKTALTGKEADILCKTREILGDMIQRVRFLTHMISPPILESGGLESALKWLGIQIESDSGLRVSFLDDMSDKPLTEEMRSVIYHAIRELLINASKHSKTDSAQVAVGRENDSIVIKVKDSGIGFDMDSGEENLAREGGGFGLFNIRRRITHLGGAFEIESAPGTGTCVTLWMPLDKNNAELRISNN
jgi:PAS domain S-box-containing protein